MSKLFKSAFATDGDFEAIAETTQPNGKMSIQDGWTTDYELARTDPNYRPIGRKEMNGILHEITGAISDLQMQGASDWSYGFEQYRVGAIVRFDGRLYILKNEEYTIDENPYNQPAAWNLLDNTISESRTITVGPGGDHTFLSNAINELAYLKPTEHISIYDARVKVKIKLLPGYVLDSQTIADDKDMGWLEIEGTETSIKSSAITKTISSNIKPVFGADNGGTAPKISGSFYMTPSAAIDICFLAVSNRGKSHISSNFRAESSGFGFHAEGQGSEITADGGFITANLAAIYASSSATISARNCSISSILSNSIEASGFATINAEFAIIGPSGRIAVDANNARVNLKDAEIWQSALSAIYADDAADVSAYGVKITQSGSSAIQSLNGSKVTVRLATITNTTGGDVWASAATVYIIESSIGTGGTRLAVFNGAIIYAALTTGTGSQANNIWTANGVIFRQ